jgi:hypothetical protein
LFALFLDEQVITIVWWSTTLALLAVVWRSFSERWERQMLPHLFFGTACKQLLMVPTRYHNISKHRMGTDVLWNWRKSLQDWKGLQLPLFYIYPFTTSLGLLSENCGDTLLSFAQRTYVADNGVVIGGKSVKWVSPWATEGAEGRIIHIWRVHAHWGHWCQGPLFSAVHTTVLNTY